MFETGEISFGEIIYETGETVFGGIVFETGEYLMKFYNC